MILFSMSSSSIGLLFLVFRGFLRRLLVFVIAELPHHHVEVSVALSFSAMDKFLALILKESIQGFHLVNVFALLYLPPFSKLFGKEKMEEFGSESNHGK